MLLHRAGKGALLKLPDALGRNPPNRDDLILARTGEWTQLRSAIKGVGEAIQRGEFDYDEPEPYVLPANSVAFDAAREAERKRGDGAAGGSAGRTGTAPNEANGRRQTSQTPRNDGAAGVLAGRTGVAPQQTSSPSAVKPDLGIPSKGPPAWELLRTLRGA